MCEIYMARSSLQTSSGLRVETELCVLYRSTTTQSDTALIVHGVQSCLEA